MEEILAPGVLSEHPNLTSPRPLSVAISCLSLPATRWRHLEALGLRTGAAQSPAVTSSPPHPTPNTNSLKDTTLDWGSTGGPRALGPPSAKAKLKRQKSLGRRAPAAPGLVAQGPAAQRSAGLPRSARGAEGRERRGTLRGDWPPARSPAAEVPGQFTSPPPTPLHPWKPQNRSPFPKETPFWFSPGKKGVMSRAGEGLQRRDRPPPPLPGGTIHPARKAGPRPAAAKREV